MKLSDERQMDLYNAIHRPIVDYRIALQRHGVPNLDLVDQRLHDLTEEIWKGLADVLRLKP